MKATTNKMDPIERRMQRGRKVARTVTLTILIAVGVTAVMNPNLFSAQLKMPTEQEREEAKKKRKKKQAKKPKRKLSKLDVQRLAKLREKRARKHMMAILRRLEARIIIAEAKEAAVTAKFRKDPQLFKSLANLIQSHGRRLEQNVSNDMRSLHQMRPRLAEEDMSKAYKFSSMARNLHWSDIPAYTKEKSLDSLDVVIQKVATIQAEIPELSSDRFQSFIEKQTKRYLQSILDNATAIKTQDRDRAVRGFAQPEDHPLTLVQRNQFDRTLSPMSMAQLHQLSQEMGTYYTNLMGDVDAGELAEVAQIPFPEALDKLAHQPFAVDDLQDILNQKMPANVEGLDKFTDALNEGQISAERALKEAGGKVPAKPGEGEGKGEGEGEGEGKAKDGKGEGEGEGEGAKLDIESKGSGKGTEQSTKEGPPTAPGQLTREQVLRSLALKSSLNVAQNRGRQIVVDKKKVLANVLPGRRFTASSDRKGYLFIDTWHIIGPWDAQADRGRTIDFSKIYPLEKKLDLDAIYTTGKTKCIYNDERGYAGKKTMTGRLVWNFYQSPTVEIRIPREQLANDALYFAYTEVYFEQDSTMNLAIASDDAARIRVNGRVVFEDTGLSPYVLSEQVRQVKFKRGVNKILVRLVNGPGPCRFSLLLTPQGASK